MHLGKSILRHALTFIEVNGLELTISVIFPKVILRKLEFYFQLDEKLAVRTGQMIYKIIDNCLFQPAHLIIADSKAMLDNEQ